MSKRPPKKHKNTFKPRQNVQGGASHGKAPKPKPSIKVNLYGFHAVEAAWLNPSRHIEALYLSENAAEGFEKAIKGKKLPENRPAPQIIDKTVIDKALPLGSVHQGIGAFAGPLPELSARDLTIAAENKDSSLLLILDQVTDPHNVGAIMRSACAFGADGIIVQTRHAPEMSGVLAKTACGAVEHVPVAYETNLSRAIEELQEAGYFVCGLDERGDDIGEYKPSAKTALVLGAEGPGIRPLVKDHCDTLLRLPMHGAMPSINVSNAAAVALYALLGSKS